MTEVTEKADFRALVKEYRDAKADNTFGAEAERWRSGLLEIRNWLEGQDMPDKIRDILNDATSSRLELAAQALEALPVLTHEQLGLKKERVLYFWLNREEGGWAPAYNAEEPGNGWATCGIRHEDGTTEVVPRPIGEWAHVDAEGNPSMPCWGEELS